MCNFHFFLIFTLLILLTYQYSTFINKNGFLKLSLLGYWMHLGFNWAFFFCSVCDLGESNLIIYASDFSSIKKMKSVRASIL